MDMMGMVEAEWVATAPTAREGGFETRRHEQEGAVYFHGNDGGQNAIAPNPPPDLDVRGGRLPHGPRTPAGDGFPPSETFA